MQQDILADLHVKSQVLSIGETVEEVSDSGFLPQAPTLKVQLLADDSMLQVDHLALPPVVNHSHIPWQPAFSPLACMHLCVYVCMYLCMYARMYMCSLS